MIEFVRKNQTKKYIKNCTHFSKGSFDAVQNGLIIRFIEMSGQRYEWDMDEEQTVKFDRNAFVLYQVFINLAQYFRTESFYIVKYREGRWYAKAEGDSLLKHAMELCRIGANFEGSIYTDEKALLKDIFYSALKYYTFPVFISGDLEYAVTPTDHLDLFISSNKPINQEALEEILVNKELEIVPWMII